MAEPKILGVREILSNFRSTLVAARQTGGPVVIALRRRKPAGVLLGYETWQALALRQTGQADAAALHAELTSERPRNGRLTADLVAARRQVEELNRDLTAARQRVADLETQLEKPPMASQSGEAWSVESLPEPAARLPEMWASWSWDGSTPPEPPVKSGWSPS